MDMDCAVCGQTTVTPVIDAVLFQGRMYHAACFTAMREREGDDDHQ